MPSGRHTAGVEAQGVNRVLGVIVESGVGRAPHRGCAQRNYEPVAHVPQRLWLGMRKLGALTICFVRELDPADPLSG